MSGPRQNGGRQNGADEKAQSFDIRFIHPGVTINGDILSIQMDRRLKAIAQTIFNVDMLDYVRAIALNSTQ